MKKFLFVIVFVSMATLATVRPALAQDTTQNAAPAQYQLLAPLPLNGVANGSTSQVTIVTYVPAAIKLFVALAGGLAVLRIVIGGFRYITAVTLNGKDDGRKRIEDALIGLLLVIGAYTILYTVNPALVAFNLNIAQIPAVSSTTAPTISIDNSTNPILPSVPGTASTCANCTAMPPNSVVPQKPPGAGLGCAATYCSLTASLIQELENLANNFGHNGWLVTEMYPPTVTHLVGSAGYSCHDVGTCADMVLLNTSDTQILAFVTAIKKSGFSGYVYEACDNSNGFTTARLTQLKNDPMLAGINFQCYPTTTGENIHVNQ